METTGGRWPARPKRIAGLLRRRDIGGDTEEMASTIRGLTDIRPAPSKAREIYAGTSDW